MSRLLFRSLIAAAVASCGSSDSPVYPGVRILEYLHSNGQALDVTWPQPVAAVYINGRWQAAGGLAAAVQNAADQNFNVIILRCAVTVGGALGPATLRRALPVCAASSSCLAQTAPLTRGAASANRRGRRPCPTRTRRAPSFSSQWVGRPRNPTAAAMRRVTAQQPLCGHSHTALTGSTLT